MVSAAPVASVPSNQATVERQKIDVYLSHDQVAAALEEIGLQRATVEAHLATLSDETIHAMAADIDLVMAGGDIQSGNVYADNPIACILRPLGRLFESLYRLIFCWSC